MKLYCVKYWKSAGGLPRFDFINAPSAQSVINFYLHAEPTLLVAMPQPNGKESPLYRTVPDCYDTPEYFHKCDVLSLYTLNLETWSLVAPVFLVNLIDEMDGTCDCNTKHSLFASPSL